MGGGAVLVQRVVMPVSGRESWTLLGDDGEVVEPAERYRPLFDNAKRLRELISELETLSAEAVEHAEGWTAP